jgi:hypothetical protein
VVKGKMNYSRRQANFISRLPDKTRDEHIRHFIASCNVDQLLPFVKIISHDKNWREVEYVIEVPETTQ